MAFPSTPVLDDLNRADGAPGANWAAEVFAGYTTMSIISNTLGPTGAFQSNYWNTIFANDQEVYLTLTALPSSPSGFRVILGLTPNTSCFAIIGFYTQDAYLQRYSGGGWTTLQTLATAGVIQVNDVLGLRRVGTTISAWRNGTQIGSDEIDGTGSGNGYIGIQVENTSSDRFDNFGGGSLGANTATVAWLGA